MRRITIKVRCPDCQCDRWTDSVCLRRALKAGRPLRCRSCAMRQRAAEAFPQHIKDRARLLRSRGYTPAEVVRHLSDEGIHVARSSVSVWTTGNHA